LDKKGATGSGAGGRRRDGSAGSQDEWKMRKGNERERERERAREGGAGGREGEKKVLSRVTTKDFLNLV